ncbi:MAG: sugar phosphate isomerase/epimerase [Bryobacteraceae bacterium]|nr:sugar phosphate isomerase/epimerase [Bryobacteraceae bacterium]
MMTIYPGINLEFIRCEDKPFLAGLDRASRMGYQWVEPMVHNGRELLSEAGYFHSVSLDEDPLYIRDLMQQYCLRASGLSSHAPLMRPEISVPWLERAIRFAAAIGTRVVNTDEGIRPPWVTREEALDVIKYTLKTVLRTAERHGVFVAIEPHQEITKTTEGLLSIVNLVDSPMLRVNYDTGNAWLGGADPYEGLQAVADRVVHVHAKDIDSGTGEVLRGKLTGTPVGCACGDGVINWRKVTEILRAANYNGVLSVECGTPEQAERSLHHLNTILEAYDEHDALRVVD